MNCDRYAAGNECVNFECKNPIIKDPSLKLDIEYQGSDDKINYNYSKGNRISLLTSVTQMAFLGDHDILMLNKNDGKVMRIVNHTLLPQPVLDLNVANKWERGLIGIAISKDNTKVHVFLYYTESKTDGGDVCPRVCAKSKEPIQNKLYRYELKNNKLINPKLLLSGPDLNVASHIGGDLEIGPDDNLYVIIGDYHASEYNRTTLADNFKNGSFPDGRTGILRINQDGKAVGDGILGKKYPLNLYYAYGVRNGYGLDFDPVSHKLWDTENGPSFGDEVNLVEPGFNGGWSKVQGIWQVNSEGHESGVVRGVPKGLVDFGGKGKFSDPEFTLNMTIAPTALKFLNSDRLGTKYVNDLFVASYKYGLIFHFDLNENRTGLKLPPNLNIMSTDYNDLEDLVFAKGLGKITDMDVGPDGKLYILSRYYNKPTIFTIS